VVTRPKPEPPPDVRATASARADARAARDWARADELKAEIEAAGWKVIDRGLDFALEPAVPPTVEAGGVVRYGSAIAVPSVLDEPPSAPCTVVTVTDDRPDDLARLLAGLRAHAPMGTQVVIVADAPGSEQAARLASGGPDLSPIAGAAPEVIWTSERRGRAAACNAGLRRARGEIVVLADASIEPTGDALSPFATVLADPNVAVAGGFGLVGADLRRFEEAPGPAVDVIELVWLAFRRADMVALGPLDERLTVSPYLDAGWSFALRAGTDDEAPPRVAVRLLLPLVRHTGGAPRLAGRDHDRLAKRSYYRLLDRFRDRTGLLSGPGPRPSADADAG
jgi:hypothetical protein